MAERGRETLRSFFRAGNLPRQDHFWDFVDSSLNMVDEGFRKSPENGFEVTSLGSRNALMSFYTSSDPKRVQWSIGYGGEAGNAQRRLVFMPREPGAGRSTLTLDPRRRVGVATDAPRQALDVNGVVRSVGRIGGYEPEKPELYHVESDGPGYEKSPVPADGKWHDITGWLRGCHAFEVMAGAGEKGRYALLHAIALNAHNPSRGFFDFLRPKKKKIRAAESYYGSRCDRLELRWNGKETDEPGGVYRLQVRSRCPYGTGARIEYHITRLWFNELMDPAKMTED